MIEFVGQVNGQAEAFFWKRARRLAIIIFYISLLILLPVVIFFAVITQYWALMIGYAILFVLVPLITLIPKTKKEKQQLLPRRIYTEDEYIVAVVGETEEFRRIEDVKVVIDHGEFYELKFPVGKVSDKFVCQKELLHYGTIEGFEALFSSKLVRKV